MFLHSKIYIAFFTIFITISMWDIPLSLAQGTSSIFTIHGIKVDETATSAIEAKKIALEKGQEQAFTKLTERLFSSSILLKTSPYDKNIVSGLVKSFEINDEHMPPKRYIATLTFHFNELKTKNYIGISSSNKIIDRLTDPILIIPIMRYSDISMGSVFWEENNLWYAAWKNYNLSNSFIPLRLPLGDLSDMQIAPEQSIIKHDLSSIKQLIQRHDTTKAIISIFEMEDTAMEHGILHLYQVNDNAITHVQTSKLQGSIFNDAIKQTIAYAETGLQSHKKINAINASTDINPSILANVVFKDIGQWINIQKYLNNIFTIQGTEIISLGYNIAQIKIKYNGSIEQLRISLQKEGLELFIPVADINHNINNQDIYEIHLTPQQQ